MCCADHLAHDETGTGTVDSVTQYREFDVRLTDVHPEMKVMREETFGPVVATSRFEKLDHAIALANATPYGLAAYVFGRDLERCLYVAVRLEAGGVGGNANDVTELAAPFGGWKESGMGGNSVLKVLSTATS